MGFAFPPLPELMLLCPAGVPVDAGLALARALLSPGGALRLIAELRFEAAWWPGSDDWMALNDALDRAEREIEDIAAPLRAEGYAVRAEVLFGESSLGPPGATVVVDGFDEDDSRRWAEILLEAGFSIVWPGSRSPSGVHNVLIPQRIGPIRLPAPPDALLRRRDLRLTLLGDAEPAEGSEERLAMDALPDGPNGLARLQRFVEDRKIELVFVPLPLLGTAGRAVLARLLGSWHGALPVTLWLQAGAGTWTPTIGQLEACDLLSVNGALIGRLERGGAMGGPVDGESVSVRRQGVELGALWVQRGCFNAALEVPSGGLTLSVGEQRASATVLPWPARVGLFDAANPGPAARLALLDPGRSWWGVRLHPEQPLSELRETLRSSGLTVLIDAEAILRDDPAEERPEGLEGVRLTRLARWLRGAGLGVDLVLAEGEGGGFLHLSPEFLPDSAALLSARVEAAWRPPAEPLLERAEARQSWASRLHLELDNRAARENLLRLVREAKERIHLRTCLYHDDLRGRELTDALLAAAGRGVDLRVMADSLYSLHGSLGQTNPALARLEARGALRVYAPVQEASLRELKRRDHCKQLLVDGRVAVLSGRNIGDPYLTGWGEVAVGAETPYRDVPWLDASVEVEGAVVRAIEASFRRAWRASGGGDFALRDAAEPGRIPVRFVEHWGLEDTLTLDAYQVLIDGAREHLTVVNTFPLHDELAHRLLAAMERGVKVRFLVGNVRPLYGARTPFPGGVWREIATRVIHGRLDALVAAGAEAYELTLRGVPGWDPAIEPVWPHVHAKLMSVDGQRYSIGSANLDLTSAYWENDDLLVVEDPASTAELDRQLDALIRGSARIDPADPAWALRASRRAWLAKSWPNLLT